MSCGTLWWPFRLAAATYWQVLTSFSFGPLPNLLKAKEIVHRSQRKAVNTVLNTLLSVIRSLWSEWQQQFKTRVLIMGRLDGRKSDWWTDDELDKIQRRHQRLNLAEADYSAPCWSTTASFQAALLSGWDHPLCWSPFFWIMLSHWLGQFIGWFNSLVPPSGTGAKHTERPAECFPLVSSPVGN